MCDKTILYECPKCHKTYKTKGWYRRHCIAKHVGVLPYIKKHIIKERDLETMIQDAVKNVLSTMDLSVNHKEWDLIKTKDDAKKSNIPNIDRSLENYHSVVNELKNYFLERNMMVM